MAGVRARADASPEREDKTLRLALDTIERIGNRLLDPATLFLIFLILVWITSALPASVQYSEMDPRTGCLALRQPVEHLG